MTDFVLRGGEVVFPDRKAAKHDVLVQGGKIEAVLAPGAAVPAGTPEQSAAGLHVFPGLIDAHVHFGFGEKITEYTHETVYAAQGGIATVLGYFLNNEAYADVYKREQEYARTRCHVDYGFHFSTANELHIKELGSYVSDYGVTSFKYFMNFKGEEGRYLGLDGTDDGFFWDLLAKSAQVGKPIIVCHTENIEIVNRTRQKVQAAGGKTLKDWAASKPAVTESEPAIRAMYFAERTGARVYFPHISSRLTLDEVRKWRKRYDHVWIETCPHYLTHTEDSELGGIGKANPPFRTKDDQDALWEALFDGTIDLVASDHSARRRATKDKPLWLAAQGFPGIAAILPVLLSEGYHKRKLPLQRICQLLASAPAKIFDLEPAKGNIAPGYDADFTIVDLNKERKFVPAEMGSWADYSLYENQVLKGWPVRTIVRGVTVMDNGKIVGPGGHGKYLWRRIGQPPILGKLNEEATTMAKSENPARAQAAANTRELIRWASETVSKPLPEPVRRRAATILSDDIGAMVAGSLEPQVARAREGLMQTSSGKLEATVFAKGAPRLDKYSAASANGMAITWCELDEGFRNASCHGGAYTIPALLAEAEAQGRTVDEVLRALAAAYEVTTRFAIAFPFPVFNVHPHAAFAPIGAAAAASLVRRYDAKKMLDAVTGAASMSFAGPFDTAVEGSLVRNAWTSAGAWIGLRSADWAEAGIGGAAVTPYDVFVGSLGTKATPGRLVEGLGEVWSVSNGYHKIFACCGYSHSAIEATLELLGRRRERKADDIAEILVETGPGGQALTTVEPETVLASKFSIPHAIAATVQLGTAGASAFTFDKLQHEGIAKLRRRVRMAPYPDLKPWPKDRPARVTLRFTDGAEMSAVCESARGGADQPFDEPTLLSKLAENAGSVFPAAPRTLTRVINGELLARPWREVVAEMVKP